MAKTSEGSSQGNNRQRPMTFVHRRDCEEVQTNVIKTNVIDGSAGVVDVQHGFSGGPIDCSLSLSFTNHITVKLWEGEVNNKTLVFKLYMFFLLLINCYNEEIFC